MADLKISEYTVDVLAPTDRLEISQDLGGETTWSTKSVKVSTLDTRYLPRSLEVDPQTGAYSILTSNNGQLVTIDGALTIPAGLGAGFHCAVFLDFGTKQTLTSSVTTTKGSPLAHISPGGMITITMLNATTVLVKGETEA